MTVRFPWPAYELPWGLELEEVNTDGQDAHDAVHADSRRIRLDERGEWQELQATVTVRTDQMVPKGLERASLRGFLLLASPQTNRRIPVPLTLDESGQRLTGCLSVHRSEVAGIVTLTSEIVCQIGDRQRHVGQAEAWVLVVDPATAPEPPGAPPFDFSWVVFDADDAPELARNNPHAHAVMDLTSKPTLLLNEGIEGFKALIQADTAKLERRRLRDVLGSGLARSASAAIMREAAWVISLDDEPNPPNDSLQAQMCEAVANTMTSVGSVEEFYQRLYETSRGNPADRVHLWAEIDVALDALTNSSRMISTACSQVRYV